jgi:hypothetical protein
MVDGVFGAELGAGATVVIQKSKHAHHMVPSGADYFELLNRKLDFGHRGSGQRGK